MKTVFSFFLSLVFCASLAAQAEAAAKFTREYGLNFTTFLDEAIDFGGGNTFLTPYWFTYKKLDEAGKGLRLGAGVGFNRRKDKEDPSGQSNSEATSSFSSFNLRIGSEKQFRLSGKWMCYYGFDGIAGFRYENIKSEGSNGTVTVKDMTTSLGGGPVMGAEFMISERVGLSTEASLYLSHTFFSEKTEFDSSFEEDEKKTTNLTGLNFSLPTNLYLFFRF